MARNSRPPQNVDDNQEEMTVVIFKLKGGSGTLQKGFEAINTAFASFGAPALPPAPSRRLPNGNGTKSVTLPADSEDSGQDEDYPEDAAPVIDAQPAKITKQRHYTKLEFMDDFDLNQSDIPWKQFAVERQPDSDNKCYLVAALWLSENAALSEFSARHVFTLFRAMKWNEQSDFVQPMRKMKQKSSYFTNPSSKTWKLTGPGLDAARAVKAK